jgi:hypothetical protein
LPFVNTAPDFYYEPQFYSICNRPEYLSAVPSSQVGISIFTPIPPSPSQTFSQFMQIQNVNRNLLGEFIISNNLAQFQQACKQYSRCQIRPSQPYA